jgi:hypothetical protein
VGRSPRRALSSIAAIAPGTVAFPVHAAKRRVGEKRQQVRRRGLVEGEGGREARDGGGRRSGERLAAGIVDRDVPARQFGDHAMRQRPVGRDEGRLAGRVLGHLAQDDGDRERLLALVGGLDHGEIRQRLGADRAARPAAHRSVVAAGRMASETMASRPWAAGGASDLDRLAHRRRRDR